MVTALRQEILNDLVGSSDLVPGPNQFACTILLRKKGGSTTCQGPPLKTESRLHVRLKNCRQPKVNIFNLLSPTGPDPEREIGYLQFQSMPKERTRHEILHTLGSSPPQPPSDPSIARQDPGPAADAFLFRTWLSLVISTRHNARVNNLALSQYGVSRIRAGLSVGPLALSTTGHNCIVCCCVCLAGVTILPGILVVPHCSPDRQLSSHCSVGFLSQQFASEVALFLS